MSKMTRKRNTRAASNIDMFDWDNTDERNTSRGIEGLNLSNYEHRMMTSTEIKEFRIFVATWNVGGITPNPGLNLEDFLKVEGSADIYICGFQEIVPLNAGNVLVIEDNEPAAIWLSLICQALNKSQQDSNHSSELNHSKLKDSMPNHFFRKPSFKKVLSKNYRADNSLLKHCNCPVESPFRNRRVTKRHDEDVSGSPHHQHESMENELLHVHDVSLSLCSSSTQMSYRLVGSKQMVGLFLAVWARNELVPHIGHLRISSVGRGIMNCLGNKGCISISMSVHRTSFCFVCSHLASGEKEGNEMKRNADVTEIMKNSQFPRICKNSHCRVPEKILDHDRIFWFGDLNYRIALSYEETRILLEDNDWDTLLQKDQLNIEKEAGRVFKGFKEGRIVFAPTYKYSQNSDSYAGETVKSKKKRRKPAWCDRIIWKGSGIEQLSYIRGESRFSDHRPVCAVFAVEVEVRRMNLFKKHFSCVTAREDYYAALI